jgi:hypothetical protein
MNHKGLLVALCVAVSLSEIAPRSPPNKLEPKNLSSDSEEDKALRFLLRAHP